MAGGRRGRLKEKGNPFEAIFSGWNQITDKGDECGILCERACVFADICCVGPK